jgi:hypothetical protein
MEEEKPIITINLGKGQPQTELLPFELIKKCCAAQEQYLTREYLRYGEPEQGVKDFRNTLAEFINNVRTFHDYN